jgi:hypothetical protein
MATLLLLAAAVAFFADMFLPWSRAPGSFVNSFGVDGWNSAPAYWAAMGSVVLIVWQTLRLVGVRATARHDAFISAVVGASVALLAGSGVAYLRYGAFGGSRVRFGYGAWVAVALSGVLLVASVLELAAYDPLLRAKARRFRLPEVGGE